MMQGLIVCECVIRISGIVTNREAVLPTLKLDETDLYYEVHGEGPAFLFCSGTAADGEGWKFYQVPEFSRDHRVIIYDQRGTGKTPVQSSDFSTERLAADAAALLDHLGANQAVVLGHSNGGRVAQLLALDYPGRVAKLILASSGGTNAKRINGISISMCTDLVEKGYLRHRRDHFIDAGFTKAYVAAHPDKVERYLESKLANLPALEVYLGQVIGRQVYNSGHRLKDIRIPTLVMVGDDEDHGSMSGMTHLSFAQDLARAIPGSKLVVMKDQGHNYHYTDPETTNRVIREFIAS